MRRTPPGYLPTLCGQSARHSAMARARTAAPPPARGSCLPRPRFVLPPHAASARCHPACGSHATQATRPPIATGQAGQDGGLPAGGTRRAGETGRGKGEGGDHTRRVHLGVDLRPLPAAGALGASVLPVLSAQGVVARQVHVRHEVAAVAPHDARAEADGARLGLAAGRAVCSRTRFHTATRE